MRLARCFTGILIVVFNLGAIAQSAVPASLSEKSPFFNVIDYGAHNDGSAPATEAFRAAIQAAKKAGGGTVYVPAGNYVSGPIELVSNLTLYIDAGATIHFPATPLPFTPGRQQGIETLTPVPLIGGHDLENVAVEGRGTLTSSNTDWMNLHGRIQPSASDPGSANGPNWEHLLQALNANKPISQEEYKAAAAELRPSFLRFMNSKNILVDGLHFVGSPMWTIHLLYSENAVVENVVIETYPGVHTDGIVIDSSRFIKLANDYIDTGDDGIVIKSGKDADGLRVDRPTENVAITNCTVHHAHGAVTIGSETSGSIRNIVASNITAFNTENGIRIKSARGRGGVVENVSFDNWTMINVGEAITITNYYLMEGETRTSEQSVSIKTPVFRNIAVSNVIVNGAKVLIDVEGLPEMPIADLHISNIIGTGRVGLIGNYSDDLELHNVQLNTEDGPAFQVENSTNLELDDVSTQMPHADAPVIRLDNTPGAIVRNSRAFPSTATFLATAPGELKNLQLDGNLLGNAKIPQEEKPNPARGAAPEQRSDR
ncbi:MAG TPA: glycoside hydrolase family 28 protein [Terracidiphilus sp.]|nr:glycoside hydrolase family 28 protein [Terracidiphilus sp.]